jgi:hypothetical protein
MGGPKIIEERDNYLLVCSGGRYAVVERRRGLYYPMHGAGSREGVSLDRQPAAQPAADWTDLTTAARILDEIANRRERLAENIW